MTITHERLNLAVDLAHRAGRYSLERFGRRHRHDTKADGSPVTEIDRAVEQLIREAIDSEFPGDVVLGEEMGQDAPTPADGGYRWIIDPIDGTQSFMRGVPLYGTLIGIERDGSVEAGVVHMPALGETVYAATGHGAFHHPAGRDPEPARLTDTASLDEAMVVSTSPDYWRRSGRENAYDRLWRACGLNRGWSDCYGAVLLVTGRIDAWVEPVMAQWDSAPMHPIVREAGGRLTDWEGNEQLGDTPVLCANPALHEAIMPLLKN